MGEKLAWLVVITCMGRAACVCHTHMHTHAHTHSMQVSRMAVVLRWVYVVDLPISRYVARSPLVIST